MSSEQYFLQGKYKLLTTAHEMRMSHRINAPVLIDTETNTTILDLADNIWDLAAASESADSIILMLRAYPAGNKAIELILYPVKGVASVNGKMIKINDVIVALDSIVAKAL